MAQGTTPNAILLEDANDLARFLEATGRTIPRHLWAEECVAAAIDAGVQGMCGI